MMKNIIAVLTALLVATGFSALAIADDGSANAGTESIMAECSKQADAQQPQDRDAFISGCLDDKMGYEKDE